ncbi:putative DNA-binding domain-containing protein [Kordiimonas sp.]|uniref:HvfC/BufC family peptide modification chaperone n=1 Tax=Kordiimonas sp. TaxID=1970157 RepID=UPI003A904640
MSELAHLQQAMKEALVSGGEPAKALQDAVVSDAIPAAGRLRIHQNNYREMLTDALLALFPVAKVFVGEAFLRGVIGKYIQQQPPQAPVLSQYGADLPAFLEDFGPARQVPYLPDVIRLEWAVHSLQLVDEMEIVPSDGLVQCSPNVRLIDSEYPILNLWMAGTGQIPPEAVHLKAGGQCAAAMLTAGEVRLIALDKAQRDAMACIEMGEPTDPAVLATLMDMALVCQKI